ncbi:21092_t:CDS:2, partial [Cetraspora pellucida]
VAILPLSAIAVADSIPNDAIDILDPVLDTTEVICDVINLSSTVAVPFSRFLPVKLYQLKQQFDIMAQLMAEKENQNNSAQSQQIVNSLFEDISIRFCEFEETTKIRGYKAKANVRNQVIILKKLKDCQQILQFYGLTSDGDKTYLVTECEELRNLKEYYMAYKPIGVKKKLRIAVDIAGGLNFLRAFHRYIRTENILITHHETAKIANFYLSRHFHDDTKTLKQSVMQHQRFYVEDIQSTLQNAKYLDLIEIKELVVDKKYREKFSVPSDLPEEYRNIAT